MSGHSIQKPRIIVILGPTAVGKSRLGIELSESIGAEIVNADSLQVYRLMDIGTAKPSEEDRARVRHHLLDIISPDEDFSAGMFKELAEEVINDLNKRSKRTVLVGGTYLYIKVLLSGLIDVLPRKPEVRDRLKQRKYIEGTTKLHDELKTVDPAAASRIDPNDYVRIERALEVHYMTGDKISELHSRHDFKEKHYDYMKIGISMERENLYKVIDNRVETMIRDGFVEEVVRLRKMGYDRSLKPMQSIGYKEINAHIDGETGLEEALGLIKRNSRRLAKRQMTWLRRDSEIKWFSMPDDFKRIVQISEQHYQDT